MKKLLILLAFAFLFLSLTSASSFDERKKYQIGRASCRERV